MRKRWWVTVLLVSAVFFCSSFHPDFAHSARKMVSIASGWVVGVYFPLAGAISRIAHEKLPDIKITVESSGASVANAKLIGTGDADLAIIRLNAPYEPREGFLERFFHAGDLDFKGEEKARILAILAQVPSIVDIYLERPAVIPEIAEKSAALLADFGASDAAVLDVIFGRFPPSGKLPFEMPSSMEAVRRQKEDVPYDSEEPLFPFGYGLTY